MPFPVSDERVDAAERELGMPLPRDLRERLKRDNGGQIMALPAQGAPPAEIDRYWDLHPVWDDGDRKRAARSAGHIVRETAQARDWPAFPAAAVSIASNGTGDRLILIPGSDGVLCWNHEDGATASVVVIWRD